MGGFFGGHIADAHALGQAGEALGHVLSDRLGGLAGFQGVGIGEKLTEDVKVFRLGQLVQVESVEDGWLGREVGVDFEAVEIGDNQQRRIFQVFAIELKLLVRFEEVAAFALIFPGEVALVPDVGPSLAAAGFMHAALEGVPGALGIGLGGFRLTQQLAKVEKVLLGRAALGEVGSFPLGDEFLRRHR